MKVTCLSNVSDNLKSLVSLRLGLSPNTFIDKQTLVDLTELYCTENNIDTVDYESYIDDIADFIVNRLNVNMDQDALGANLETGLLVSEDDYDAFYEQNQMLLNTEIEATPENLSTALSATEIHSFAKIINLENGNIYVSFPEATFGEVYVSPRKLTHQEKMQGYTLEMKLIKSDSIADGTFMKAPNGKDTNLTERQWLQVRTKAFKDWFGDWELAAYYSNIEKAVTNETLLSEFIKYFDSSIVNKDNEKYTQKLNHKHLSVLADLIRTIDKTNETKIKVKFYDESKFKAGYGFISQENGDIYLPDRDNNGLTDEDIQTFIHEFAHHITLDSYFKNDKFRREVASIRQTLVDSLKERGLNNRLQEYGFKNDAEFIAEAFSNSSFQQLLKDCPSKNKIKKQSLWSKFVQAIKEIVNERWGGGKNYNTLLDDIFELIENNVSNYTGNHYIDNASKVVDENGEPLPVYHHTDNPNLTEFSTDFENYFSKEGGTKEAIFFDENKTGTLGRKYDIPVFLNIRELNEYNETKQQLHDRGTTYREVVNQSAERNNKDGGVHMKDFDDNRMEHQSIWIVHNPNQIKSATDNVGGFSTEDNNIYHNRALAEIYLGLLNYARQVTTGNDFKVSLKRFNELYGTDFQYRDNKRGDVRFGSGKLQGVSIYNANDTQIQAKTRINRAVLLDYLTSKFGLKTKVLDDSQYNKKFGQFSNCSIVGDTVYLRDKKVYEPEQVIEEFLHPCVHAIYDYNKELAQKLLDEANKNFPDLAKLIGIMYGDQEQNVQDEELITHVLSKYLNKEISDNGTNTRNLVDYIHQFFDKILELFKDLFGDIRVSKDDRITISGKDIKDALSYENLAELINSKQIRFNDRLVGNDYRNNIDANTQSSKQISISTEGYHKGDPQRNPDTAYVFTENAQAHLYSITGDLSDSVLGDTVTPKLNVSDVNRTNQAGIRTDKNGNLSENAFGIVVKKRLQDNSGKWLSKEGLFEDSEEDFDLFKTFNIHVFNDIEDSGLSKIVFPSQMALGKSALPKRFTEWLQKELKSRFGINSTIYKNTTSGYDGYGLQINSVEQQLQQRRPQQKQKTLDDYVKEFDDLVKFFGERVVKDKDFKKNHTYWVIDETGKKHKAVSVTQYIKGESSSSGSENPSLSIGNSFDKFVRDYFDGKDVSKATYANIPTLKSKNPLRAKLIQLLDNFKAALDQRFGKGKYRVITKEFTIEGKVGNKYIAGTADMYVIDDKGNVYIFDMKTYSSERNFDKESKSTYPAQVSLYRELIGNNLPFGSTLLVSDLTGLIVARVKYPNEADTSYGDRNNFDSNNGVVSRNGKDIASYKFFDIDIEHNGSLLGGFVKGLQIKQFKEEIQGLSREERQDLMELLDETTIPPVAEPTPEEPQPVMDKPSVVFEENNVVPNTDIVKISRSIVKQISMYCDMLTKDYQGDLAMNLLGPDFVQLDDAGLWENMPTSSSDLLSRQGTYKAMFERLVQINFPYGENEYNDWLNENVGYLINSSFGELKKLEGVHIDVTGSIIIDSQEDDDTQSLYDAVRDELEKEIDSYDIDKRTQSIKENMPLVLKRKIFNIPKYVYDDFGNAIRNVDGTMQLQTDENGLPDFVGEDDVVTTLSQNLHGLRTLSDMMKRLEELKEDIPWVNEVIRMLDKDSDGYDKAAADVFFKTFRKSETLYTNIYKKKGKKKVFVLQPSNLGNKSKRMYNQAIKTILEGQYDTVLKKSGKNMSSVVVDENGLLDLEQYLEYLDDAIKGVDNNRRFDKKEAVNAILNLCDVLGFVIEDESNLNKLVIKGKGKEKISAQGLYDIVKQFHSQLKGFVGKEMQLNDKRITDPYNKIANMLSVLSGQVVEKTTRDAQKTYQTYTESSPLQDLVDELRGDDIASQQDHDDYAEYGYSDGIFADQEHRFNKFRQFRRVQDGRNIYVSSWLRKLAYGENGSDKVLLRSLIRHFVHTSTDGKQYFKLNDDQYMLSLLLGYYLPSRTNMFDSYRKDMMLCRVPVISDKNSQEWILFEKEAVIADPSDPESIEEFKDAIVDASKEFFYFELQRMKSVLNHLRTGNPEDDIPNFHLKRDKAAALKSGKITRDMLMKDGKLADWVLKSGLSFRYFPMLNHEIENNTQFGKDVIALLNAKTEQEFEKRITKMAGFREAFKRGMDDAFEVFKENLSEPVKKNLLNSVDNMTKDELNTSLLEYFYNDFIATANVLNLTLADPAFFKDTIDLQKRFAQYHSQTQKVNTEAEFQFEGMDEPKRFSDGKFRFVTIKTLKQDSPLIDVTRKMFDRLANEELKQNGDTAKYKELVLMRDTVPNFFEKVDVTDGQAYHSITSMWKKLNMLGASSEDIERFYKAVKGLGDGDISIRNINVVLQSMKPVVTGFVERGYDSKISSQDNTILVPTYIKDSESLIFLAGAILHGANENHVLSDLYEFMESSHFNGELTFENYNSQGIDTVCFDSAVKNGGGYVIDLNGYKNPGEALYALESICYDDDGQYSKWVQSMPYEGWGIQLNVPEHMQDHSQDLGSQDKILAVSDLPEDLGNMKVWQIDQLGKRTVQQDYSDRKQFLKDYFGLIDKEFKIGFKELDELFGIRFNNGILTVDKDVFNQAISNMATENVIKDARYSIELFKAVAFLDENKDFITTIGDPQIADTIFGTVFTKIKNYVNKQKVPGGPVVQMSPFGLNDNLHIKDSDGNIMGSKKFDERKGLTYECYITAPTREIERKITYSSDSKKMKKMKFSRTYQDGDILDMKDILDNNILTKEDLEFIAYRIPTEDKYSIYRMEIKGFLSRKSGEIIIMPQDLTALSGTDFDIDKMYCWFKATSDDLYHPISERDMIHNQMFEMQWAALGHPTSVQHQLNPGNYLLLQDIANEVDVPSGEDDSLMYSHNQVKIKKANAAGKNYVGIAALNNTCHGISNMIDVRFKTMFDFNIDGVTKDMVMQQDESGNSFFQVDPIYSAFDGSRISKTLSMFVGAAADNAKQMLLGRLNTNPTTANIVMGMIRMGIPIRTVCYMMKTPIVLGLIDEAESKGKFFEEVIMADKTSRIDDSNAMSFKIEGSEGGNMYRYIHGTISEREKKSLEKAIITFLKNMVSYSRNISDLNTLLSLNSTKNAVGPTIYDTISKWFKISMFPDKVSLDKTAFDNNLWDRIRENAPFIKTLYDTYNEYAIGICKQISPVCNDEFTQQILPILRSYDSQSDILSEDNLKKLINAYMLYRASKLGVVKTDEASRRELLYEFPIKFLKEQYRFGDNAFLSALEVTEKMNRSNKIPNIKLDMSRATKDIVDLLQASWSQLVSMTPGSENASEMKNLSDMLLTYFSARFGYMWQPNSALNAAPNDAKNKFEGYSLIFDAGATPDWSDVDAVNVIQQFARNNPDCGLFYNIDDVKERSVNKKKKYYVKYSDWTESRFGFKVKNQLFLSNPYASPVTIENEEYIEVRPVSRLGIDKNFMEYDASKMGSDMKTVVSQEETEKATKEYNEYVDLLNLQQQGESEEFQDQEDDDYDDEDTGTTPTYDSSTESNPVEGATLSDTEEQIAKEILDLIKQNDLSVAFEEYNSVYSILNSREDFYDKVNDLLADESYSEKEKVLVEINNKIADIC